MTEGTELENYDYNGDGGDGVCIKDDAYGQGGNHQLCTEEGRRWLGS